MVAFAMHAHLSVSASRRHLVWMLWLALLLPVAQFAATRHALSHGLEQASVQPGKQAAVHAGAACDMCLLAAAVGGGAPLETVHVAALAPPRIAPRSVFDAVATLAPQRPYQSRAPPLTTR